MRQLNRSWRAGVARSASPIGRSLNRSSAKRLAELTTPSAPLKEASRYFVEVASTPPLRGGEYVTVILNHST